jgi:hypothetical protein
VRTVQNKAKSLEEKLVVTEDELSRLQIGHQTCEEALESRSELKDIDALHDLPKNEHAEDVL